ncbi:MAG: TIGR00725 family protein [Nitrospirota bacterium]
MRKVYVGVIGAGTCDSETYQMAYEVGRLIALNRACLLCGGLSGVMEAAAKGSKDAAGMTIGILPGKDKKAANPFIDVTVATGFNEGRNVIIATTADALIAVGGEFGTLSEIALGLKMNKPVISLKSWEIKGVIPASSPEDAVRKALEAVGASKG